MENKLKYSLFAFLILMITSIACFSQDDVVPTIEGPEVNGLPATLSGGITSGQVYTLVPPMDNCVWSVSEAGKITEGQGTNSITVDWIEPTSQQSVSVTFGASESRMSAAVVEPTALLINFFPFPVAILPETIPQFMDPLPHFAAGLRVDAKAGGNLLIKTVPVRQKALSTGTAVTGGTIIADPTSEIGMGNYAAYAISKDNGKTFGPAMWPAQTIEARQGFPLKVKYQNDLFDVRYSAFNILADQTLMMKGYELTGNPLTDPYEGDIPMVVHLHGGEIPSDSDGGPNAWFTPGYKRLGPAFSYNASSLSTYPNMQEATTLWYHPHDDGLTRINVYTGLAGFYFIRGDDEGQAELPGWSGDDLVEEVTPAGKTATFNIDRGAYLPEIELAIQDRMFNVDGELFWPVEPPNPDIHPFWTPEFVGDVMVVNGKSWPYLSVAPRKYRFRILDGCNARFLNMWLADANGKPGPAITVIGGEGGLLAKPVVLNLAATDPETLLLAPGQRYDVVIDFAGYLEGTTFTLMNDAGTPYPFGSPVEVGFTDRIMQFVVNGKMISATSQGAGTDNSLLPVNLRPVTPLVKLTDFQGALTPTVVPDVQRQLVLNEVSTTAGGPAAVLINNAFFDADLAIPGTPLKFGGPTEIPREGTTEIFQIINISADAHPIHIHLTQWQIVSRQDIDVNGYMDAYAAAWIPRGLPEFPIGQGYPGGAGSPYPYDELINGFVGGNPDVTPFLLGSVIPADPEEWGWKDNVIVLPGQVTTLITRIAPTDRPIDATAEKLMFPFDPSAGPGYVWHCHIIDHEDMSMMRPLPITPSVVRTPHFTTVWSGNGYDHMNFYALTAVNNGIDLQPGDEIGIFDGNACVGAGVVSQVLGGVSILKIKVSRDDSSTPEKEGYTTGNQATFKLWIASKQLEVSTVEVTYVLPSNSYFLPGASSSFHIRGYNSIDQHVSLLNGWNIFSLYVTPEDINMLQVVQPLIKAGTLEKVQDESGFAIERDLTLPLSWINDIKNWRNTEGYKIRVNESTSLIVRGLPIYKPFDIDLQSGWNIISYPVSTPQSTREILAGLIASNHLVKVMDEKGNAIEIIPGMSEWTYDIDEFLPGEGYKVRVSANEILRFNLSTSWPETIEVLKSATIAAVPEYYKPTWKGNGIDHMNFYLSEIGKPSILKAGNEIGIYDENNCVGAGIIQNKGQNFFSFVVSADDLATIEVDGFIEGHTPSFRVWNPVTKLETSLEAFEYTAGSSSVFKKMASAKVQLNIKALGLDDPFDAITSLGDNYPNPFSGETTIPYVIGEETKVDISIFDMLGKKLNTLVHGSLQSGSYTTVWKANDGHSNKVNPGIYVCKMLAGDKAFVKLVVVK